MARLSSTRARGALLSKLDVDPMIRPTDARARSRTPIALAALLALIALATVGCERTTAHDRDLLRVAVPGQPANLDPNKTSDAISGYVLTQMHEGLTRHDANLGVEPGLAESWEFSADLTKITYHIRKDAKWSDGKALTAHDFEYSWKRLLDPKLAAEYAYFVYDIKGAESYNSGKGSREDVGVRALDDYTLEVELSRPAAYFPHITTFIVTCPVRRDVIEKYGDDWTRPENAVYSGPYRATEWIDEYKMTMEVNPHFPLAKPSIPRLEMYTLSEKATAINLFVTGRMDVVLDMLPIAIPAFRGKPSYFNGPKLEVRYVAFRITDKGPVSKVKVRMALAKSIQREEIPRILKGGEIATKTWLPKGMFGHNDDIGHTYDPEAARKLLAEAGYPGGEGFPKQVILFRAGDDWRLIAENLQEQWKRELGIDVEIQTREQKVFFQEIDSTSPPPMHLARWIADFPDPENFMGLFKSNSGNNALGFANTRYDELVTNAVKEPRAEERQKMYDEAQRLLVKDEIAMVPIYTGAQNILVNPELEGMKFHPMDEFDFEQARWRVGGGAK